MGKTNRFVYVASAIAAINGALFGYDTGIISGTLLYTKKDFALSSFLQELVVSEVLVRAVLGAAVGASNLLVSLTFLSLVGAIGRPFTLLLYAVIGVAAIVFVHFLVPETKGRSLEEIQRHWIKRSSETDSP
jgi:uncharacterized membrane protein YuzA (DUF378 family)